MRTSPAARIPALVAALGIFPLLALVLKRAIDVPFWDEWEWAQLAFAAHRHTLTLARLWQPHNEHRIFVPNLLMLALDAFGGWTPIREQLLSLALLALTQFALWVLVRRTVPVASRGACFLVASVLLLGLAQYENLDWGFQMAWFLCDLGAVVAVLLLTRPRGSPLDLTLAMAAATIASLSSSQGLLAWPVGLVAILMLPRGRVLRGCAWSIVGGAVIAIVRSGPMPGNEQGHVGLTHVLLLGRYVLAYLGTPVAMSFGTPAAMLAGAVLLVWLAVLALAAARAAGGRRVRLVPWFALAAYPVLCALATATGRAGFGLDQAISSRYVSIASLGWIAALAATCVLVPALRVPRTRAALVSAAMALLLLASVKQSLAGNYAWHLHVGDLRAGREAIAAADTRGLTHVFPDRAFVAVLLGELAAVRDGVFRTSGGAP